VVGCTADADLNTEAGPRKESDVGCWVQTRVDREGTWVTAERTGSLSVGSEAEMDSADSSEV